MQCLQTPQSAVCQRGANIAVVAMTHAGIHWRHGLPPPILMPCFAWPHHYDLHQLCRSPTHTPSRPHIHPPSCAAYAGHTVLNLLFPWRFASHNKALKPLVADLPAEQRAAAEAAGRNAGIEVVTARWAEAFKLKGRAGRHGWAALWLLVPAHKNPSI